MTSLTFSELCPRWDTLLQPKFDKKNLTDLCDWRNCVVGEVYGKSDAYVDSNTRCHGCYICSVKFYSEAMNEKDHKYVKDFEPMKKEFVEHWEKVHLYK